MTHAKKILLGCIGLLVVGLGSLYLVPMGRYLPEVEQLLTKQLHLPVKVTALNLAAFPLPHLEVHDLEVGGTGGISVQTIAVTPDFMSLLSGQPQIRQVSLEHASVSLATVQKLIALQQAHQSTEKSKVTLRELTATDVALVMTGFTLPDLAARVNFSEAGGLEKIWIAQGQEHLTATLLPQAEHHFALQVSGKDWAVPVAPKWVLNEVQLEGVLSDHDLVAKSFSAKMGDLQLASTLSLAFGRTWRVSGKVDKLILPLESIGKLQEPMREMKGTVQVVGQFDGSGATWADLQRRVSFHGQLGGKDLQVRVAADATQLLQLDELTGKLDTQGAQIKVDGLVGQLFGGKLDGRVAYALDNRVLDADVTLSEIDMQPLVAALTNRVLFSGRLDGHSTMNIRLAEMDAFPRNAQIGGEFKLQKGVLSKVSLVDAANLSKDKSDNSKPATTEFDEFTGRAQVDGGGYHFSQLNLTSGVLRAKGKVDMSPDKKLSGDLDADLKGTLSIVSVPLVVSGTLDEPRVAPSAGFVAGAAVGTAVLPGVGTVVGMKIGGFLNRVFGGSAPAQSAVPNR